MDCSRFVRNLGINDYLRGINNDELFGRDINFDSFKYIDDNNINAFMNQTNPNDIDIQDEHYPDHETIWEMHPKRSNLILSKAVINLLHQPWLLCVD